MLFDLACLGLPILGLICLVLFIELIVHLEKTKSSKSKLFQLDNFEKIIVFSIVICVILGIMAIYALNYVYEPPDRGWYSYEVFIENDGGDLIEIDIPLPHDERIYSDLEFFQNPNRRDDPVPSTQILNVSINESEHGRVLKIITDDNLFVYSMYQDLNNDINPNLRLTTQVNNDAYINLNATDSANVSITLKLTLRWPVGVPFDEQHRYLSISAEPFNVPDRIPDTQMHTEANIFNREGARLNTGWNSLLITRDEFRMLE